MAATLKVSLSRKWFNDPNLMPFFEKGVEAFASVYDLFFLKPITSSSSIVPNSSDDSTSDSDSEAKTYFKIY